jgi:hypothetical protein
MFFDRPIQNDKILWGILHTLFVLNNTSFRLVVSEASRNKNSPQWVVLVYFIDLFTRSIIFVVVWFYLVVHSLDPYVIICYVWTISFAYRLGWYIFVVFYLLLLRHTTDAKWWQKLTWPLTRWAKKAFIALFDRKLMKYTKYMVPQIRQLKCTTTKYIWRKLIYHWYRTKPGRDGPWVGPFQKCVRQTCPPFKMAAVTKNRSFFNCPLLLYYKSKWAQIYRYKSTERKISQKNQEYMLNYSLPCSCS